MQNLHGVKQTFPIVTDIGTVTMSLPSLPPVQSAPSSPLVSLGQALPQRVGADHAFDQLLPEHALRDDPLPLLAHQLRRAQRAGVQEGQDVLRYVVQTLGCRGREISFSLMETVWFDMCVIKLDKTVTSIN